MYVAANEPTQFLGCYATQEGLSLSLSLSLNCAFLRSASAWTSLVLLSGLTISCPPQGAGPGTTGLELEGSVVDAVSPTTPIANVYVYIPHIPTTSRQAGPPEEAVAQDDTDENGRFVLENIPPQDFSLKVAPPEGSGYAPPLEMQFRDIHEGMSLPDVRITLLEQEIQNQLVSFQIVPPSATLQVEQTQQFTIEVPGIDLPETLAPTWLISGEVGTITENGLFTATQEGYGMVVAYLGDLVASAMISVGTGQITLTLTSDRETGEAPLTVTLTGSAQLADVDHPIAEYRLDFGDETAPWVSSDPPTNVSHTYQQAGFYTAELKATDTLGRSATASKIILVTTPVGVSAR